jgi:hypothetical protein
MKYDVIWNTQKTIDRSTLVMNFWRGVADKVAQELQQLQPAERDDKTHQGLPAKLRRMADAAKAQSWRAEILLKEATGCIAANKAWPWTSEDLLWFYPELASIEDSLLQLSL